MRPLLRRDALLMLGGAGFTMPGRAWAQDAPTLPQPSTPPLPAVTSPLPPVVPRPPAPPTPPAAAVDRSKTYYVFFDQTIDLASMRALRRQLLTLVEGGVSDIVLIIHSPGGLVDATIVTYGFIRALPVRISTHAVSFVQSAATILFLAGEQRSCDRNARFMFHPSQFPMTGSMSMGQLQERMVLMGTSNTMMTEVLRDRTTLPETEIERFGRDEVIYAAEPARAAGIVQTVSDLRIPADKSRVVFLD